VRGRGSSAVNTMLHMMLPLQESKRVDVAQVPSTLCCT